MFVKVKFKTLTRRGSRGELLMQSMSVVFPNGYVASVSGPINLESEEGTAWNNPGTGAKVGVIAAPLAGPGAGAPIGSAGTRRGGGDHADSIRKAHTSTPGTP